MWELDSKKAERRRIDAVELWYWRRLLRVPWTARRFNQSILKEIGPGCSLEAETNTSATSWEELTHWKRPWCSEGLRAGGEGDDRGWDGWMASPTRWTWVCVNSRSWWWTGRLAFCSSWGRKELDMTERLNWTEVNWISVFQTQTDCQEIPGIYHPLITMISSSILGPYWPGEFLFQCPIILPFHTVHEVLKAKILKWFAIPFSSGPYSVRSRHHDPPILGCPTGMA